MNRKRAGALPQYVNFRGEPLGVRRDLAKAQQQHAERRTDEAAGRELTAADRQRVIGALIVAGLQRGKTPLYHLLRALGWKRDDGRAFVANEVAAALRDGVAAGRVQLLAGQSCQIGWTQRRERLGELLAQPGAEG